MLDFHGWEGIIPPDSMRHLFARFIGLAMLALVPASWAATVSYTFEAPSFTLSETTPLLSRAPNAGSSSFRADFTSSPAANGLGISAAALSPFFSGQILFDPFPPAGADALTISLNTAVTSVTVDFSLFAPDHLTLTSSAGSISSPVLPSGQWGTLSFASVTPFTQFTLQGFGPGNQPTQLAIDNLVMTVVPEPSLLGLLCFGLFLPRAVLSEKSRVNGR